jgi:hypothetical protein
MSVRVNIDCPDTRADDFYAIDNVEQYTELPDFLVGEVVNLIAIVNGSEVTLYCC